MNGMFIEDKADGYVEFCDAEKNSFLSEQEMSSSKKASKVLSQNNSKTSNKDKEP